MNRIIVGIDGSDGSRRALAWAAGEARAHDVALVVVHAWHVPYAAGTELAAPVLDMDTFQEAARQVLQDELAQAAAQLEGLTTERHLGTGAPAEVLVDLAGPDDLLVVGSRGRGGFTGLLLGSVSQQVAHRSPCPVVIIPSVDT